MCYKLLQELHVNQAPSGLGVLVVLPPQKASNAGGWGRGNPPTQIPSPARVWACRGKDTRVKPAHPHPLTNPTPHSPVLTPTAVNPAQEQEH